VIGLPKTKGEADDTVCVAGPVCIKKNPFIGEEKSDDDEAAAAAAAKKAKVKAQESKSVLEALKGKAVASAAVAAPVGPVAAPVAKKTVPIIRSVSAFKPIAAQPSNTHTVVNNGTPTYLLTPSSLVPAAAPAAALVPYTFKLNKQEDLVYVYADSICISKIPQKVMKDMIDAHKV
jgi:hypothetical protein